LGDTTSSLIHFIGRGTASVVLATARPVDIPTLAARRCQAATDVPATFAGAAI
jgi:hypothetical protein